MNRRNLLAGLAGLGIPAAVSGVLATHDSNVTNSTNTTNGTTNETINESTGGQEGPEEWPGVETSFELVDPDDIDSGGTPEISVDGQVVTVEGVLTYNSSSCGTAELVYAGYEKTQSRVDVIVAAVDADTETEICLTDMVEVGYRVRVEAEGDFTRVTVSSHGATGTNSASVTSR